MSNRIKEKNKAAQKRLGIDTKTLLQSAICNKNISGGIRVGEYTLFWERMEEKTDTQEFLFDLLKKFLDEVKSEKSSDNKETMNLGSYVNTIQFICLFLPENDNPANQASAIGTPQVKRWLKSWKADNEKHSLTQHFPATKNVISSLKAIQEGKVLYNSSIIGCSTLHTASEFEKLLDIVENPTSEPDLIKSGEQCFLYSYLCRLAHTSEEQRMGILTQTRNKVQSMSSQLKINPRLAETTLLALLHMMKQFMAIAPVTDKKFLQRTIQTIQEFYLWPCPYGNVTRNLLELFHHEMMCPGASWVSSFRADCAGGTVKNRNKNSFCKKVKSLYYLTFSKNKTGRMWTKIMQLQLRSKAVIERRMSAGGNNMKDQTRQLPGATQAMIILHMLNNAKLVTPEDVDNFTKLKEVQVNELYTTLETMIEESKKFELPEQAQQYQVKQLTQIQLELNKISATPKPGRKISFGDVKPEAPFFVSLPPFSHILADCDNLEMSKEHIDVLRMQQLDYRPYLLYEGMEDIFSSILHACSKESKPLELRLVIAGGDRLIAIILNTFLRIGQINPRWLRKINLKFLLLPWGKNSLSDFIARHDSWYHRHIYVPFQSKSPFLIPWIDPEDLDREEFKYNDEEEKILPPAIFLRDTMNLYARQATSVCPITVYKLEGWSPKNGNELPNSKDDEPNLPDDLIGFCLRVEIGQSAEDDTKSEAGGTFQPPDMDLTFTPMNLAGENEEPITEENISLNNLLITNIPRRDDKCFPPNPLCPWLEMYAEPKSGAKHLANDQRQHISELILKCNNPSTTFGVLVDGERFGPYNHIKITQVTMTNDNNSGNSGDKKKEENVSQDEIPFTLNIQTFFDINI